MPDWNPLLAERLGHLTLAQEMREEVVNELATHLEEHYQELRAHGVSDSESVSVALSQVVDWEALGRKIIEAKNEGERMNDRTKQFWLPGLVTLTATMLWLMFLQRLNWRPQTAFVHGSPPLCPISSGCSRSLSSAQPARICLAVREETESQELPLGYFLPSACLACSSLWA